MIALGALAVVHILAGWIIATRILRTKRFCDVFLICLLTAATTFYGFPIVIGWMTGLINTTTVVAPTILVLAGASVLIYQKPRRSCISQLIAGWKSIGINGQFLTALIIVFALGLLFIGSRLPVRTWDAGSYHINSPMRWVQSGRFQLDSFGDPIANPYLAAGESYANVKAVLPFLVMLWTGDTAGTALAQWPYLCVLIVALYALYRRLGFSVRLTLTGIIFCISAPEVILQSVEAYADLAYFAAVVAVLWVCLVTWQDMPSRTTLASGAMAFTLLAGTKPTALPTCAILGIAYLIIVFTKAPTRKIVRRLSLTVLALLSVLILAALVAGPWYIHAWHTLGNPVYPIGVKVFGITLFHGPFLPSANNDFVTKYTSRSGFSAWWGMMTEQWRPPNLASWSGGLGLAAFAVGLPCVSLYVLMVSFCKREKGTLLVLFLFLCLVASNPTPALGRFSLYTLAIGGFCIAGVGKHLCKISRAVLITVTLCLCGHNLFVTIPSILYRQRPADLVFFDLFSGYTRTAKTDTLPDDYQASDYWLDSIADKDSRIAITDSFKPWNLFSPESKPDIIRLPVKPKESPAQWLERALDSNATHICIARKSPYFTDTLRDKVNFKLLYHDVQGRTTRPPFMPLPTEAAIFEIIRKNQ